MRWKIKLTVSVINGLNGGLLAGGSKREEKVDKVRLVMKGGTIIQHTELMHPFKIQIISKC